MALGGLNNWNGCEYFYFTNITLACTSPRQKHVCHNSGIIIGPDPFSNSSEIFVMHVPTMHMSFGKFCNSSVT